MLAKGALLDQVKKEAEKYETDIQAKDLKIQALILELAHLRRLGYGVKNEALSGLQLDLFEETCNEVVAALEPEVEQAGDQAGDTVTKPKRGPPAVSPCHSICRVLNTPHEPKSCQFGQCGKDFVKSAKTSPSNSMSSPPCSLSTATSVHNRLAVTGAIKSAV